MEKEAYHKLPFLDVLVNDNDPNSLLTSVYRKKTFTGLLTNYFSFTLYFYKVGLIRTLDDRAYKIKVQLTAQIFFRLYKSFCLLDHHCKTIIVVAIFVNFP